MATAAVVGLESVAVMVAADPESSVIAVGERLMVAEDASSSVMVNVCAVAPSVAPVTEAMSIVNVSSPSTRLSDTGVMVAVPVVFPAAMFMVLEE